MSRALNVTLVSIALATSPQALPEPASPQCAQTSETRVIIGVDCHDEEYVKALLDLAAIAAMEEKSAIIIIGRLGGGERRRELTWQRLNVVRGYLVQQRHVSKEQVIVGEGQRVRGLAHVEIYVSGKLTTVFKMKRHRNFGHGGCQPTG